MNALRIGIIGVGGMGTFHARTLASMPDVSVTAVSDPHEPNAVAMRDELGARVVADPIELIGQVDALVVASPDDTHADLTVGALEAGVPTLLEKPLATSVADAHRVMEAEVASGNRSIQLGFMREYDPAHVQVASQLAQIGHVDHVHALHRNANPRPRPLDQIVVQSMIHDVHTVRFLTGRAITHVTASGSGAANDSFRHIVAVCRLDDGAHAVVEFDDGGFAYEVSVEVLGSNGDLLTGPPVRARHRAAGLESVHLGTDWFGWFAEAYRIQDEVWVESVRAGNTTGPSVWDGLEAQRVVAAIMESLASGDGVPIEPTGRPELYT